MAVMPLKSGITIHVIGHGLSERLGMADVPEVLQEDQAKINRFGNLNSQCTALRIELAELEKKKQAYADANDELELAQAEGTLESVPYQVGNTFMVFPIDVAIEEVGKDSSPNTTRSDELRAQIAEKEAEMATLRAILYGKFGRERINLGD
jgi:prefoldin subunit 4